MERNAFTERIFISVVINVISITAVDATTEGVTLYLMKRLEKFSWLLLKAPGKSRQRVAIKTHKR